MPDITSLLTALYVAGLSVLIGTAYSILTQGGELLSFIPEKVSAWVTRYDDPTESMYTRVQRRPWYKAKVLKLVTCGKCMAGQAALWLFLFFGPLQLTPVSLFLYLGTICAAIVFTSLILSYVGSNS